MNRRRILIAVSLLVLLATFTLIHGQDSNPPQFTVQVLKLGDTPTYDFAVSADGRLAAVYVGKFSALMMSISIVEYVVDADLLPIRLFDLDTGEVLYELTEFTDYVVDAAFSSDGRMLATVQRNGIVSLWDVETGQRVRDLLIPFGVVSIRFVSDNQSLVLATSDTINQFLVLDVESGHITDLWRLLVDSFGELKLTDVQYRLDYQYTTFAVSPDAALLMTASANGEVLFWDTDTLQQQVIKPKDEEKFGQFNIRQFQLVDGGKTLYYHDRETLSVHRLDVESRSEVTSYPLESASFAVSSVENKIAWADDNGLWIANLDQLDAATQLYAGAFLQTRSGLPVMAFSQDGKRLVVGTPFVAADQEGFNTMLIVDFE